MIDPHDFAIAVGHPAEAITPEQATRNRGPLVEELARQWIIRININLASGMRKFTIDADCDSDFLREVCEGVRNAFDMKGWVVVSHGWDGNILTFRERPPCPTPST